MEIKATYIKVGEQHYPATISGSLVDKAWGGRASMAITLAMSHADALALFSEGARWSVITESDGLAARVDEDGKPILNESGEPVIEPTTITQAYDYSEYSVAGDIIDHRDGTITVKMGRLTDLEAALVAIFG